MSLLDMISAGKKRNENSIGMYCHKCYTLTTTKEENLLPYKVHKIVIPIKNFDCDPRLLQIHNHLVTKPWRCLTQYVYLTKNTPYASLYVVSSIHRKLAPHEEICHWTFCQPEEALHDLKGKYRFW